MNRSRGGKTLIEVSVVLAMTSVAMSLATATLITLFRVERQARSDAAQDIALARLASRWRADVHAATSASTGVDCQLTLPNGPSVHYSFQSPAVSREVRRGEQVEHRDAFVLSRTARAQFTSEPITGTQLLSIVIQPAELTNPAHSVPVRRQTIAAALNLQRGLSSAEGPR